MARRIALPNSKRAALERRRLALPDARAAGRAHYKDAAKRWSTIVNKFYSDTHMRDFFKTVYTIDELNRIRREDLVRLCADWELEVSEFAPREHLLAHIINAQVDEALHHLNEGIKNGQTTKANP